MKILVVEDHPHIRANIIEYLNLKGHTTEGAVHGEEALTMLHGSYDVIILDVNMPIMNGEVFLERIRADHRETPVIALTSNALIDDKVALFERGADDYMTKPFDMRELEARIIALGRRKEKTIEEQITFGPYTIETGKKVVQKGSMKLELTAKEYGILEFLARNKGYPKTKMEILDAVWGLREAELAMNSITLEAHISLLRKKLGKDVIETIKGIGYVLQ